MGPVRVAIIDPHEIVVAGLHTLLARYPLRAQMVDWPSDDEVDLILYGVDDERATSHDAQLHALLRRSSAMVVAYGWTPDGRTAVDAAACGLHEFLPKQLAADVLVARIEDLHRNRRPAASLPQSGDCHLESAGLTGRELKVLTLIAAGHSNLEIAAELFLSINTVKTYVRTAYRKIGAQRRAQAVLWAEQHGLGGSPDEDALSEVDAESGPANRGGMTGPWVTRQVPPRLPTGHDPRPPMEAPTA